MADRLEFAIAQLAYITAEIHRNHKERSQPYSPADFIMRRLTDETELEPEPEEDHDGPSPFYRSMRGFMQRQEASGRR